MSKFILALLFLAIFSGCVVKPMTLEKMKEAQGNELQNDIGRGGGD